MQAAFVEFDAHPDQARRGDHRRRRQELLGRAPTSPTCRSCGAALPTVGIQTEKPVIAATSGWVVGGAMVMTMMADLCISSESTKFYYPKPSWALPVASSSGLAGRIPHKIARKIIMMCKPMEAKRAYDVGPGQQAGASRQQVEEAVAWGQELATYAPLVLATIKRFHYPERAAKGPSELMGHAMVRSRARAGERGRQEGGRAFREKRTPCSRGAEAGLAGDYQVRGFRVLRGGLIAPLRESLKQVAAPLLDRAPWRQLARDRRRVRRQHRLVRPQAGRHGHGVPGAR